MRKVPYVEAVIDGKRYQIGRLSAADGSWVVSLLTNKMRAARQATPLEVGPPDEQAAEALSKISLEEGMMQTASFLVTQLSRSEIAEVMEMCLQRCSYVQKHGDSEAPMPIMSGSLFSYEEIENDGLLCLELTKRCLAFNIAGFTTADESSSTRPASVGSNQ
jgi:hypothetical protein